MIRWIRSLFTKTKPAPAEWRYVGHDYCGINNDAHVYAVRYTDGRIVSVREHRFHHAHEDARLVPHFANLARTMTEGAHGR